MDLCLSHENCIEEALLKAEMICKDRGVRLTKLRREVLEVIWESHAPVKAYEILDKLHKHSSIPRPPTVYRSLDFLLENGLIHKLASYKAYIGCSHPLRHKDCYFLICNLCGEIAECCDHVITKNIVMSANKHCFNLGQITLEIEGVCIQCKA